MPTVMTVLEARVLREQWGAWAQTYRERLGRAVPSQMVRSVLVQSASDPEVWQGISF